MGSTDLYSILVDDVSLRRMLRVSVGEQSLQRPFGQLSRDELLSTLRLLNIPFNDQEADSKDPKALLEALKAALHGGPTFEKMDLLQHASQSNNEIEAVSLSRQLYEPSKASTHRALDASLDALIREARVLGHTALVSGHPCKMRQ